MDDDTRRILATGTAQDVRVHLRNLADQIEVLRAQLVELDADSELGNAATIERARRIAFSDDIAELKSTTTDLAEEREKMSLAIARKKP